MHYKFGNSQSDIIEAPSSPILQCSNLKIKSTDVQNFHICPCFRVKYLKGGWCGSNWHKPELNKVFFGFLNKMAINIFERNLWAVS